MARLRQNLMKLHNCLANPSNEHKVDAEQASLLSGDIAKHALSVDNHGNAVENTCSALFDANYGVVSFLRKTVNDDKLFASKLKILEFLPGFLNIAGKSVLPYAVSLKDVCLWVYSGDKGAKSRNNVLTVLLTVLRLCSGNAVANDLQPDAIIQRFFSELAQTSKISSTVQQNIFHLLGVIAESFPEFASPYNERFQTTFCSYLRKEMTVKSKKPDFSVIVGCLLGLNSLLIKFPCKQNEAEEIFSFVRKAIIFNRDLSLAVPRAGLSIVSRHAALFRIPMFDNYQSIYEHVKSWSEISNNDTRKLALTALEKFLQQVSKVVCEKMSNGSDTSQARTAFMFFLNKFKDIFKLSISRSVTVAIKGFGYFAAACKLFWNVDEVNEMFVHVLQRCEQLFLSQTNGGGERDEHHLQYLPSYIEALASILSQLDEVNEMFLLDLERLVVFLIENFPRVPNSMQFLCYNSIIKLFAALYPRASAFTSFVHKIVYQGILRTCSHDVPFAEDVAKKSYVNTVTYKSYVYLWINLLNAVQIKEFNNQDLPLETRQTITDAVYDEIVLSVLTIVAKLDLTCTKHADADDTVAGSGSGVSDVATSNPIAGLRATNPKDFQILVNVVEFSRCLLPENHVGNFTKWVYRFGREIASHSTKHPLVSGFYKLLAMCFKICSDTRYFRDVVQQQQQLQPPQANDDEDLDVRSTTNQLDERTVSFKLFAKCAVEITFRLLQYKEDLLASCLEAILSLPSEIVSHEKVLLSITPAVCTAFRLGPSYLPMADLGLTAMECWGRQLPRAQLLPLYSEVLPLLNSFLKSTSQTDVGDKLDVFETKSSKAKKSFEKMAKEQLLTGDERANRSYVLADERIKRRIVRLLGSVGNDLNRLVVSSQPSPELAVAWDSNRHLKFAVPFADMKPVIYLDYFLPRVVELACSSSNRQIKVTAAELLHALVIYMLGSNAAKTEIMQRKLPYVKLYARILPAVLRLACDVDLVTNQLFEPLAMQMIHWFSNNKKGEDDVGVLVDALMEGIVNSTDSALRDFSGRCIREFVVWSIKQSSPKEQAANPHNTASLLNKIYSMCLHPSSFMRLGAALAFNSIYAVFREEAALVDAFTFEILYHFVESLALAQKDEEHLGAREQCLLALDHVERIIKVKCGVLNAESKRRQVPRGFGDGTLGGAVDWLLRQCGRAETECRHRCMHLVYHLCADVTGVKSRPDYFKRLFSESGGGGGGAASLVEIFEGTSETSATGPRPCLRTWPTHCVAFAESQFTVGQLVNWFDFLVASLDCYMWVFTAKLIEPAAFFSNASNCGSCLETSFHDFLDRVSTRDLTRIAEEHGHSDVLTPRTIDVYNRGKCTVIVRCLDFVHALFESTVAAPKDDGDTAAILRRFTGDSFWRLLVRCVLCPLSIGFDMTDAEVIGNLPIVTGRLLKAIQRHGNFVPDLTAIFRAEVAANNFNLFEMLETIPDERKVCVINTRLLVEGYVQLLDDGYQLSVLIEAQTDCRDMASKLLNIAWKMCTTARLARTIEGNYHQLANCIVRLALRINTDLDLIMDYLMDDQSMSHVTSKSTIARGAHFYLTFKSEVNAYLIHDYDKVIVYLLERLQRNSTLTTSLLMGMLDSLIANRELRKRHCAAINRVLCTNWGKLIGWCRAQSSDERKNLLLHFMRKMFLIDSAFISMPVLFAPLLDTYLTMLVDASTSLKFKSGVLNLLPFFTRATGDNLVALKQHLVKLAGQHFPLLSCELSAASTAYGEFVHAFRKILSALQLSGSIMLFEFVVELTCIETEHILEDELQDAVVSFVKRLPVNALLTAVCVPFKIFCDDNANPAEFRHSALHRFCLPLLRKINRAALFDFFEENICVIMDTLQAKLIKSTEAKIQSQLVSKTGCFRLMETLYNRGTKDELVTIQSKVNSKFCKGKPSTGKEMTQEITRAAHSAKKDQMQGITEKSDLRLDYQCSAYNTLTAVIRCTQTEVKFYKAFLFTENIAKGEYLWDNLVDLTRTYAFSIEQDVPIEKRKILKDTRYEARMSSRSDGDVDEYDVDASYPLTVRQMATMNLASSSLAEDVSQFDFTSSEVHSSVSSNQMSETTTTVTRVRAVEEYENMEMDDLNRHPCMTSFGSLLHHLAQKISPPPPPSGDPVTIDTLPQWMNSMRAKFVEQATHNNVKLFVARLIINNEKVFRPYARVWLYPLMQFAVSGATGSGLNYFVTDLVTVILSWQSVAIPEDTVIDREMAGRVLEYLMRHAYHNNRSILRNNLEIIKTVVECWKTRLDISYKVIYDNLSDSTPDRLTNLIGVQLVGVVMSSGLEVFSPTVGVSQQQFLKALSDNMSSNKKEVYSSAAEVCGMVLKHLHGKAKSDDFPFHTIVKSLLDKLRDTASDKFLYCLHRIQSHYSLMVDGLLSKVLYLLPSLHGIFREMALEIMATRLPLIDDAYRELKVIGLSKFLSHGEDALQLVTLQIVNKILPKLTPEQISELLPLFEQLSSHDNETVRQLVFNALIWIYDNYGKGEISDEEREITSRVKSLLLLGLVDPDTALRLTVLNFWSERLPTTTPKRMVSLITSMYLPITEPHFLGYCTNLLLELTSKSPDFLRPVFASPLSDCKFYDYSVSTSWRSRHASMVPLFVETQSSQMGSQNDGGGGRGYSVQPASGQLRATQENLEFAPTQDTDLKRPFNWLTQNTFDASVSVPMTPSETNQSSLLFSPRKSGYKKWDKPVDANFGKRPSTLSDASSDEGDRVDGRLIRKRFVKDSEATKIFFMQHHSRLSKQRDEMVHSQKMAREAQVTMYRQYRAGDFPDILVPHSAIIAPLQALAQKDDEIARLLLVALATSIFDEASSQSTADEWASTLPKITLGLNDILLNTKTYNRAVVAFVLEFYYHNCGQFQLDLENVTLALKHSGQSIGALLLEKMILRGTHDDETTTPVTKRQRRLVRSITSAEKTLWIKLAELNKLQGNFEVTRAIFAHKISTQSGTREALEAEERQDYALALRKYEKLDTKYKDRNLDVDDGDDATNMEEVDLAEVDLWEGSVLKCYDRLTKWDYLCQYAQSRDNLDDLWSDIVYQELHLPYVVRGKLKLIMRGQDEREFVQFLDASLLVTGRQQFLESRHAEELALLSVVQRDYNRACHYQYMCVERFLREWRGLSGLSLTGHQHLLSGVQKMVEMEEFLNVMRGDWQEQSSIGLMNVWDKRLPKSLGDLGVVGDIVDNRNLYMRQIELRCRTNGGGGDDDASQDESQMETEPDSPLSGALIKKRALECQLALSLLCVDSASCLNNVTVAFSHMKKSFKFVKQLRDDTKRVQCYHAYAKLHLQESKSLSGASASLHVQDEEKLALDTKRVSKLLDVWDVLDEKVDEQVLRRNPTLSLEQFDLQSHVAEIFVEYVETENGLLDLIPSDKRPGFLKRVGCAALDLDKVIDGLTDFSYKQLKQAVIVTKKQENDITAAAQFKLAVFCDKHLKRIQASSSAGTSAEKFAQVMTVNLLDSIRIGHQGSVQLFPRLLQLIEEYPKLRAIFVEKVSAVPCWVLLRWNAQLVALLDKSVASAVTPLVVAMVEQYPHALIYPFRVSRKGFRFDSTADGKRNLAAVNKIENALSKLWLVDHFIQALEHLSSPVTDYMDHRSQLIELFSQGRTAFLDGFKKVYEKIFVKPLEDSDIPVPYGKFKKSFAKSYRKIFDQKFGKDLSKLQTISLRDFNAAQIQVCDQLKNAVVLPKSLKLYCDWLADFQQSKFGVELEIPGQYDGLSKPMPEYHTKIAKFSDQVLVMTSIRQPKRIVIYGNDYKEYKMLIKNGEDLRTDQRIEQLFQIMNQIYRTRATGFNKELKIVTYQVIPINDRLGMLEWLDDTMPLKEFLEKSMTDEETKRLGETTRRYLLWLEKDFKSDYAALVQNGNPKVALAKYHEMVACVPRYLLKTAFLRMSSGLEAYLSLRTHFAVSHAAMCVSQYVLGIGDRHTSNSLVCQRTGAIVGIDFGHAFGSATQFLPTPELMPFRLTPQFLNLMEPMRHHGLIESTMIHALSALRADPDVLLSTMDVFVKEPTLDWINFAKKQNPKKLKTSKAEENVDANWYPRQKIEIARRKLAGDNSAQIMLEELESHKLRPHYSKLGELCKGSKNYGHRKQYEFKSLSVENQVACLLDHATDEYIMAHTYRGWAAWM